MAIRSSSASRSHSVAGMARQLLVPMVDLVCPPPPLPPPILLLHQEPCSLQSRRSRSWHGHVGEPHVAFGRGASCRAGRPGRQSGKIRVCRIEVSIIKKRCSLHSNDGLNPFSNLFVIGSRAHFSGPHPLTRTKDPQTLTALTAYNEEILLRRKIIVTTETRQKPLFRQSLQRQFMQICIISNTRKAPPRTAAFSPVAQQALNIKCCVPVSPRPLKKSHQIPGPHSTGVTIR